MSLQEVLTLPVEDAMGYMQAWELERLTPTMLLWTMAELAAGHFKTKSGKTLKLELPKVVPLLARYLGQAVPRQKPVAPRELTEEEQLAADLQFANDMLGD